MRALNTWIHLRLRRGERPTAGGVAEDGARLHEQQHRADTLATRVRELERDVAETQALAVEVERLTRARTGVPTSVPSSGAPPAALLRSACDMLTTAPASIQGDPPQAQLSAPVSALIRIRDDLLAASRRGTGDGAAMARWAYDELASVLDLDGVQTLDSQGPFDPRRQEVLETRPTEDPARDRMIAATVRPGYATNGSLVRAQGVVVYALSSRPAHAPKPAGTPASPKDAQ